MLGRHMREHDCEVQTDETTGVITLLGLELITETIEKIALIGQRIQEAQCRQKINTYKDSETVYFRSWRYGFFEVAAHRGLQRSRKLGQLASRFISPFWVMERVGEVTYRLYFPPQFTAMHEVFHVSVLKDYVHDPSHVLDYSSLVVRDCLTYEDRPLQILDRKE